MYYLRINKKGFSFISEISANILEGDIPILEKDYVTFFKQQNNGVEYRLKSEFGEGIGLFDYIEEIPKTPTIEERLDFLESIVLSNLQK